MGIHTWNIDSVYHTQKKIRTKCYYLYDGIQIKYLDYTFIIVLKLN